MKEFQLESFQLKKVSMNLFRNRKVTTYILKNVLIAIPFGCISLIEVTGEWAFLGLKLIQVVTFAGLGVWHNLILQRKLIFAQHSLQERLYWFLVLGLIIYGALWLFYFIIRANRQQLALASSSAFLLPYVMQLAWHYYNYNSKSVNNNI